MSTLQDRPYILIDKFGNSDFKYLLSELRDCNIIALDTETNSLDPLTGVLKLIQIGTDNATFLLDVQSLGKKYTTYIIALIQSSGKLCILHNAKFDLKYLKVNTGIMLTNVFDTMIAEAVITAGYGTRYPALRDLLAQHLQVNVDKDIRSKFYESEVITEDMLLYAALDVKHLKKLREAQLTLIAYHSLQRTIDLEMALVPAIAQMELNGVPLDANLWTETYEYYLKKLEEVDKKLRAEFIEKYFDNHSPRNALVAFDDFSIAVKTKKKTAFLEEITDPEFIRRQLSEEFNIGSPKQLVKAFNLAGINISSTGEEVLKAYLVHPGDSTGLVELLLKYRDAAKKTSTYGLEYLKNIHPLTNRVHADSNQLGTHTGRLSYNNPNLQQIPRDVEEMDGKQVAMFRRAIKAGEGCKLICADYNQAELRIAGALSGDRGITEAYQAGKDIHTDTAVGMFRKPEEEITKDERYKAKTINFSIIYGATPQGITYKNPDIPLEESKDLVRKYFNLRFELKAFIDAIGKEVMKTYFSVTPMGRKRFFEKKTMFASEREEAKYYTSLRREGVNHVVQGCSADAVKIAMVTMYNTNPFGEDFKLILQVHDELVFEVKAEIAEQAREFVKHVMESSEQMFLGNLPAIVEANIADSWEK